MRYTLKKLLVLPVLVAFAGSVFALDVFKQVDENGNVIFTDTPQGAAERPVEKVEIRETNTVKAAPKPVMSRLIGENTGLDEVPGSEVVYEFLAIAHPEDGAVFKRNETEFVEIFIVSEPQTVAEGHNLKVWINGELQENSSHQFQIETPFRGSYTIDAAIVDEEDEVLVSADTVTFVIFQPSVIEQSWPNFPNGVNQDRKDGAPGQNLPGNANSVGQGLKNNLPKVRP